MSAQVQTLIGATEEEALVVAEATLGVFAQMPAPLPNAGYHPGSQRVQLVRRYRQRLACFKLNVVNLWSKQATRR